MVVGGAGRARQHLAVDRDRAVEVALLHERAAQVVARGGVLGMLGQERAQRGHRLLGLAFLHEHEAQAVPRVDSVGRELGRAPQLRGRAREVAHLLERQAEVLMGHGQRRGQLHRAA